MNIVDNYNPRLANLQVSSKVKIIGRHRSKNYLMQYEQDAIAVGNIVTIQKVYANCDDHDKRECSCRSNGRLYAIPVPGSTYGVSLCHCRLVDPVTNKEYI